MNQQKASNEDEFNLLDEFGYKSKPSTEQQIIEEEQQQQQQKREFLQSHKSFSLQDSLSQQSKSILLDVDDDKENEKLSNSSLGQINQQSIKSIKFHSIISQSKLKNTHSSILAFFDKKQPEIQLIINNWKKLDEQTNQQYDEMKAKFIELCTFPKAFFALKNFHLKLAQSDQIFASTYYEKETQENDKHSSIIHKACQDGAGEQQITLLVNSHLQKQEIMENEFKAKFEEQELFILNEYEQLIIQLYEQRQEFLHLKLQDISDNTLQANLYEDFLSEIQSQDSSLTQLPNNNAGSNSGTSSTYSQIANGLQNFMTGNGIKTEGSKHKIQLCFGLQKKRIFQIQIQNKSVQSIFSNLSHLKKAQYNNNPYSNFIYGQNSKNAIINIMNSVAKFNHHFKRYFKFRTDIHFPSFYQQYQEGCQKKNNQEDGDVVVTRHSCSGKAHYMFTVMRKEDNKKLDFSFLKQVIKLSNQMQIKKIVIPIQLVIMQQKDLKTNTDILKEFCQTLKRELQILSFDYSYSQQFLKKVHIILPIENMRMKEMYEKYKVVLLQTLE